MKICIRGPSDMEPLPLMVKELASCNNITREKSVRFLLKTWLPDQSEIDDDSMKKLWKGLFYCVWHADKLAVQTDLIDNLSSVLPTLDLSLSLHYLSVFLVTMRREWAGIDALRLDKFYLLIRRFLHCFFLMLKRNSWDLELLRRMMGILGERTFFADDKFLGNGVNYHIASVFLEELRPFLPVRKEVLEVIFALFVSVLGKVSDKVLLGKIRSNVFDVLLQTGKELLELMKLEGEVDSSDDAVILGSIGLTMDLSIKFFNMGSSQECCQGNRKVLFSLHHEFLKLEKDLRSSGIEIFIPEVDDVEENDVPNLIPVGGEMQLDSSAADDTNGSAKKLLKKCKKVSAVNGKKAENKKQKKMEALSKADTRSSLTNEDNTNVVENHENLNDEHITEGNSITFNESVISNLQMQFEKVAAEVGLENCVASACDLPTVIVKGSISKKRKRRKSMDGKQSQISESTSVADTLGDASVKSGEKSSKKVRFSMKNNLVWKPHSPLPPQSLRLPPSVTPRGSALKKGIPPGPIKEMPSATKRVKQKSKCVKKGRKGIKRIKKLKSLST